MYCVGMDPSLACNDRPTYTGQTIEWIHATLVAGRPGQCGHMAVYSIRVRIPRHNLCPLSLHIIDSPVSHFIQKLCVCCVCLYIPYSTQKYYCTHGSVPTSCIPIENIHVGS